MKERVFAFFIRVVLNILGFTWRVEYRLKHESIQDGFVYVFWHRYILPLAYLYRNQGVGIVISKSKDGEIISAVVEKMGYKPIRGSSSKGGSEALRECVRFLREGGVLAITPDGPKGPIYHAYEGFATAAKIATVKVVPICVIAKPAIRLKSWDRMVIPLPFSKLEVVTEEQVDGVSSDCFEETKEKLIQMEEWDKTRE